LVGYESAKIVSREMRLNYSARKFDSETAFGDAAAEFVIVGKIIGKGLEPARAVQSLFSQSKRRTEAKLKPTLD